MLLEQLLKIYWKQHNPFKIRCIIGNHKNKNMTQSKSLTICLQLIEIQIKLEKSQMKLKCG